MSTVSAFSRLLVHCCSLLTCDGTVPIMQGMDDIHHPEILRGCRLGVSNLWSCKNLILVSTGQLVCKWLS